MTNKRPRPYTNGNKETRNNRRDDGNNHNSVLLAGGISIDDHCYRPDELANRRFILEERDKGFESGAWDFKTDEAQAQRSIVECLVSPGSTDQHQAERKSTELKCHYTAGSECIYGSTCRSCT